jgi:hypothetical protein
MSASWERPVDEPIRGIQPDQAGKPIAALGTGGARS